MKKNYFLRELRSVPFQIRKLPSAFVRLFKRRVLPSLRFKGYRREQKRETAEQCAFALVRARLADKVVADTRNARLPGIRQRTEVWDVLEDAGFCVKCIGSESSGVVTRYRGTKQLVGLKRFWSRKLLHDEPEEKEGPLLGLVQFRQKLSDTLPARIPFERVLEHYCRPDATTAVAVTRVQEEFINQINSVNLDHSWKTRTSSGRYFAPSVELVQLHVGTIYRMVRLYTRGSDIGGQSIPKEARARITIDREPTTELDFCASIPRLAYHTRGFDVPPDGDLYQADRILSRAARDIVKQATLICLCASSRKDAVGAVWKLLREHSLHHDPEKIVRRIERVHRRIKNDFYSDRGARLMTIEGNVMLETLKRVVLTAKKPALPIHDALRVKVSDADFAHQTMSATYLQIVKFRPALKRS